ncbi:hypothetical protein K492DRAFT_200662 [Lichtheimia hyalospora FSU 10163]|nr:hypothetical protein K492DRAFT_200662 [Lichtheimia hyalospora FSU 10163]
MYTKINRQMDDQRMIAVDSVRALSRIFVTDDSNIPDRVLYQINGFRSLMILTNRENLCDAQTSISSLQHYHLLRYLNLAFGDSIPGLQVRVFGTHLRRSEAVPNHHMLLRPG